MLSSTSSDFTVTRPSLQLHAAFHSHQIYYFHFHCLREWCLWHSSAVHTIRATQTKDPLYAYLIQFYSGHISAIITKSIKIIPQCPSKNVYRRGVWELGVEWAALPPMSTQIPLRSQIPTKVFVKFFFFFSVRLSQSPFLLSSRASFIWIFPLHPITNLFNVHITWDCDLLDSWHSNNLYFAAFFCSFSGEIQ